MPANKLGYKMSEGKLIKYLYNGRQKWREKALSKSSHIRNLEWTNRDLSFSRDHWRMETLKLRKELAEYKELLSEANSLKKSEDYSAYELVNSAPLKRHRYPLWQIQCSVEMYLFGGQGFRSTSMMWKILQQYMPLKTPHFNTIRSWVLRLGHYKLHQPIEQASDWILILDYTLQMGKEQCLLILGVRQSQLISSENWHPSTNMMHVLDLSMTHWPNAIHVEQRLSVVLKQTGQVLQIVADGAKAIQNGITEAAQQLSLNLVYTYDVSHLIANQLKKLLQNHPDWKDLEKAINKIQKTTQQTTASFLAPPSLRKKARYMNLFKIADWTTNILAYQERNNFELLATEWSFNQGKLQDLIVLPKEILELKSSSETGLISDFCKKNKKCVLLNSLPIEHDGLQQFEKRFVHLEPCKNFIFQLQQLIQFITMLLFDLKHNGLSKTVFEKWEEIEPEYFEPLARQFWTKCLPVLKNNVDKLEENQTYLASSDIIESIFGQYKAKGQDYWLKGMTEQILFMPALTGELNTLIMSNALINTPFQKVLSWFYLQREERSFLAKRREALSQPELKNDFKNDLKELFGDKEKKGAKVVRRNFSPTLYYLTA